VAPVVSTPYLGNRNRVGNPARETAVGRLPWRRKQRHPAGLSDRWRAGRRGSFTTHESTTV
jgi:hypothetical protein